VLRTLDFKDFSFNRIPSLALITLVAYFESTVTAVFKCPIKQVYRECNQVADDLAKIACHCKETKLYYSWRQLPQIARGHAVADAAGIPYIRCKG
jgi:hypothetical protein